MKGWLVVNAFVEWKKFAELYDFFEKSAEKLNISLEVIPTDRLIATIEGDYLRERPDFVIFWDKDVYLAERLEKMGLRLFNSAKSIELCDNKIKTAIGLSGRVPTPETIPVPKTFEGVGYNKFDFLYEAEKLLGYPMVIKEAYGSFGAQVYLAENDDEAKRIFAAIGHKDCLMQKFIAVSRGKDVRINVVGGSVVAAMLRVNENDFRSNITGGAKAKPYVPTKEQAEIAVKAARALGLDFAGVDVLFGEKGSLVCEVNSNPHFKSTFDVTGVDMSKLILEYIVSELTK